MTVGIERHFLLEHDGWRSQASTPQAPYQGYTSVEGGRTICMRITGDRTWLTLKGYISDLNRGEFEYEIPLKHTRQMVDSMCPFKMEKRRYRVPYDGFVFGIDEYDGDSTLLIVAEIGLPSKDARFGKPNWLGEEVMSDDRFTNAYLSKHPYLAWEK